ncbi:MAG: hypothetical protein Q8Q00_04815 [Dehalococcoidia bacterium]|nr:hypothetical protein [Dehalococcoidia bacterium]
MSSTRQPASRRLTTLRLILGEFLTSRGRLDLLVFWGRYPCGWFDRRAIKPHTRASRVEIERALEELIEEGVVRRHRDGPVASYALTEAGGIRRAVEDFARLTPNERRYLLHLSTGQEAPSEKHPGRPLSRRLRRIIEGAEP